METLHGLRDKVVGVGVLCNLDCIGIRAPGLVFMLHHSGFRTGTGLRPR
jgi:hypothetical protein